MNGYSSTIEILPVTEKGRLIKTKDFNPVQVNRKTYKSSLQEWDILLCRSSLSGVRVANILDY